MSWPRAIASGISFGSDPSATGSTSKIYAKTVGGGGTGVFVQTPSGTPDEMVSKSKAIVFGLIF